MTTEKQQYDIAIVGGGMAGSSLALLLSQFSPSLRIILIEAFKTKKPTDLPSYDDRSSALSLGSIRIFQTIGLWKKLQPHMEAIKKVHVSDRGHPAGTLMDAAEMGIREDNLGYVIENRYLGSVLLSELEARNAITVKDETKVARVSPKAGSVEVVTEGGEQVSAALLVLADGAESPMRKQLGIEVNKSSYGQAAVIANVSLSASHDNIAYERFTDTGPIALLPLPDFQNEHRCALVWTVALDQMDAVAELDDGDFINKLQQAFGGRSGFFTHAGKRHVYPLHLYQAQEQARSRIVLMGNAAHSMHPVAGQGFNLSLRDCQALAQIVAEAVANNQDIGSLTVLNSYVKGQQQDQRKTIGASHLLTLLFSNDNTLAAFARNSGLFGLNFLPGLKQWFARHAMGLGGQGAGPRWIKK